ncbi:hypothetical protein A1O7_01510 [Cladophialophora yegresii CBS 114405]|uniref:BRCT domain-containing protein n=1 Tax=Cladophialophora yegresii CBS 114405 TaxID=1182544 RepID=W9WJL6_9EURO|nr:uncharacterized protein A1O7_01510 [Cladophialophora yegresii CBS 114405]EXJ65170.1 hypothetical protein A1O7_01510 [Cladophialophora yegresii CBS 114405]
MAPRRPASPAKPRRTTRARAGDADTITTTAAQPTKTRKTKAASIPTTTRAQAIESKSRVAKKAASTTAPKSEAVRSSRATTRSTKATIPSALDVEVESDGEELEPVVEVTVAQPSMKPSRATRTATNPTSAATGTTTQTSATTGLAAAPRRRIKVTPLIEHDSQREPVPAPPTEDKTAKKSSTNSKKEKAEAEVKPSTSTRTKRSATQAKLNEVSDEPNTKEPEPKKRGKTRAGTAKVEKQPEPEVPAETAKERGRGKKEKAPTEQAGQTESEPVTTRKTRTRSGSTEDPVVKEARISVVVPSRKKVTFEPLPEDEEDEKENKRPKTLAKTKGSKASATITKISEPAATGMRAKPIRKPAATRTTKGARCASRVAPTPAAEEMYVDKPEKRMPRALTPKKITQIAKASSIDDSEDDEDELSGAKTPVRDLGLSPRRGFTPAAARPLSPVKTLDFATALKHNSPEKSHSGAPLSFMSSPRRMPASPVKDSLKESPRRAPEGVTIFRAHVPDAGNTGSLVSSPPKNQSVLQQSPKRALGDQIVFPPSAMKSRATPLKNSFLSSPARRLFSASKPKFPARLSPSPKKVFGQENAAPLTEVGEPDEVEISSHFRSSVSPRRSARVYRLSEDELAQELEAEVNFDESVLDVRSPLKVDKINPVVADATATITTAAAQTLENHAERGEHEVDEETSIDTLHDNTAADEDHDETIVDHTFEAEEASDEDDGALHGVSLDEVSADEPIMDQAQHGQSTQKPRMSDTLFSRMRQLDDESEDELAGEQTPDNRVLRPTFRPSMSAANTRTRLSTGVVPQSASRHLGFTPLVAQVQGWRAGSPGKRTPGAARPASQGLFSPAAQMHVEGLVELNRPDTPGSKRKSLAARLSLAPSSIGSPLKPDFFADGMAAQDFEEQIEGEQDIAPEQHQDLHNFIRQDVAEPDAGSASDMQAGPAEGVVEDSVPETGELTTDLVNFTNASDTAMVDFKALANEAEELASHEDDQSMLSNTSVSSTDEQKQTTETGKILEETVPNVVSEVEQEDQSMLSSSSGSFGDENAAPIAELPEQPESVQRAEASAGSDDDEKDHDADNDDAGTLLYENELTTMAHNPVTELLCETTAASIEVSPWKGDTSGSLAEMDFSVTPVRPDPVFPRQIHTVVSKVPLRPEGEVPEVSPLRIPRKRARSLSSSTPQGVKRRSLGFDFPAMVADDPLVTPRANRASPQRRVRSAAPSPANSVATSLMTPSQISFSIEDFGDSTLDGIETPEDELMSDDVGEGLADTEFNGQDESVMTIGSALFKTPIAPAMRHRVAPASAQANGPTTPRYAMSTKSSKSRLAATPSITPSRTATPVAMKSATPAKAMTPSTALRSKLAAKPLQTERTPLKAVGSGVLHGAIVHTDIHTSEGMDASAFYIDILTSMGARVVKEWRWNPRSSMVNPDDESQETLSPSPGITHVVYKDGGKRTLEKVRSAKGQVLCVGVGWVLDCMREGKWLDESVYAVNQSIMPRGGTNRRKSMEPRMLVNENGLLSASKERRSRSVSVGVEMHCLREDLKQELINTPVRGREILNGCADGVEDDAEETEISSTYNSPTAATVGGGGDTANVGLLMAAQQDANAVRTPGSVISRRRAKVEVATPQSTSLAVDYDPRTAATPLTPYLVAKGRDLIQMSAPPKQVNKGLFDQDEEDNSLLSGQTENDTREDGAKKFQVKGKGKGTGKKVFDGRRRTLGVPGLGFRPVVGSPLRKE